MREMTSTTQNKTQRKKKITETLTPERINELYLESMKQATLEKEPVLYRVAQLWWPHFENDFKDNQVSTLDKLDVYMDKSRDSLKVMAEEYAYKKVGNRESDKYRQVVNQFLKSNTGKMFERFIGLSIAHALKESKSKFAIWPFRADVKKVCKYLDKKYFKVGCKLGEKSYMTAIDSDLIIFAPDDQDHDFYMLSIKSTLKDRFHNVPFWNLLRLCALNNTHNVSTENSNVLKRAKYVAACTDLAEEQPDFSNAKGPRNLLCLDAAILDGAYVSASKAKGLGNDENHFGEKRASAFYPLSKFVLMLCQPSDRAK